MGQLLITNAAKLVSAVSGGFVLSGLAATLSRSGFLDAGQGSFALTGESATLTNTPAGGSLLKINLSYDSSWSSAPSYYQTDVVTAANMIMAAFPNTNITLTIEVGYTEIENIPGSVAANTSAGTDAFEASIPYATIKSHMASIPSPTASLTAALAALPSGTSLGGVTNFNVSWAGCKALGLYGFTSGPTGPNDTSQIDGAIGIGTGWSSAKTVGVFLHEIAHCMGRIVGQGTPIAPFCFTRFTAAGVWDVSGTGSSSAYFSLDGGTTNLAQYAPSSDLGDFANTVTDPGSGLTDAFDAQQSNTPDEALSPLDIKLMNAMGFQ